MKLRFLVILSAVVLTSAVAANAQVGVYASFDAERFYESGLLANPIPGTPNHVEPLLYGPTVGAYLNFGRIPGLGKYGVLHTGPFRLGVDARGDFLRGARYSRDDGLVGLRLSLKSPYRTFTPYIQGSAGAGHTKVPGALYYTNNWSYQFAVGADRKLKGRVDWRVIEATAGFLGNFSTGYNANQTNYIVTVGTGLVMHLPGR